jgi:hypothetical protein
MKRTHVMSGLLTASIVLLPAAALAVPKGKPGLWNITSTMKMANAPQLPPQVLEMMKKRGMPGMGEPTTSQICVAGDAPSADAMTRMQNQHGINCTPHILNETATSATTEVTCHGTMEGTGRSQISWRGDNHYEGSYSFKGSMRDHPQEYSTHYVGDWAKSDCGAVKPFSAKDIPAHSPPPPR